MTRAFKLLATVLVTGGAAVAVITPLVFRSPVLPIANVGKEGPPKGAEMFPWREPSADLKRFFPAATGHKPEERYLTSARPEIKRRLGREPIPEDHTLYLNRVLKGKEWVGAVMVRRIKGAEGVLEAVVAVDAQGRVAGVRLQRQRESAEAAKRLNDPAWLGRFRGKTADGDWTMPALPGAAAESGRALTEGVRTAMVLLDIAEKRGVLPQTRSGPNFVTGSEGGHAH